MAGRASARGNTGVIKSCTSKRGKVFMAGFTSGSGGNMISWFAQCSSTVMTTRTASHDASMVHGRARECGRRFMTGFTTSAGRDMVG